MFEDNVETCVGSEGIKDVDNVLVIVPFKYLLSSGGGKTTLIATSL